MGYHPNRKDTRLLGYYLWSNTWEVGVGVAITASSIGSLIAHNENTSVSKVWGDPYDTAILVVSALSGLAVLVGLLAWIPRVRAAGLVMLATVLIVLSISAVHAVGYRQAAYGATAYLCLACAAIARAAGVVHQGDYPPRRRSGDFPRRGMNGK